MIDLDAPNEGVNTRTGAVDTGNDVLITGDVWKLYEGLRKRYDHKIHPNHYCTLV